MLLVRESKSSGKLYVINITDNIVSSETLLDAYKIDELVYEAEDRSTIEQITERFESKKNDYLLAYCGNKLIGYLSYFPINNECRDNLLNKDDFMDGRIVSTHILKSKLQGSSVYIVSVAVLPEYQGLGLGVTLAKELSKRFEYLNYMYGCEDVIATAINEKGVRVLESSGFSKLKVKPDKSCVMGKSIIENV